MNLHLTCPRRGDQDSRLVVLLAVQLVLVLGNLDGPILVARELERYIEAKITR